MTAHSIPELDPEVVVLLSELPVSELPMAQTPVGELRQQFGELLNTLHPAPPSSFDGMITDGVIDSVPVRSYLPAGYSGSDVVVLFHGGGWVVGDRDSADPGAREIARALTVRVVSVDYRRAPEHAHPAAYADCLAVTRALAAAGPRWLGVAGDSAGGNLAAAVALSGDVEVDAQMLFYPALDPTMSSKSYAEFFEGYLLTGEAMAYYWQAYQGVSRGDESTFAVSLSSAVGKAPATVIATAGFDPLRDEGAAFASELVTRGVATTYLPFPTLIHGWVDQTDRVAAAARARDQVIAAFGEVRTRQTTP